MEEQVRLTHSNMVYFAGNKMNKDSDDFEKRFIDEDDFDEDETEDDEE